MKTSKSRTFAKITLLLAALLALYGCGGGTGSDSQAASDEVHTVEHALGESAIPVDPQRVVVLDPYVVLPTLLDIGVPVVGAGSQYAGGGLEEVYFEPAEVEGIEVVGEADQPNFESVAALQPDLIIGWTNFVEPFYEELRQIAPTVATEGSVLRGDHWKFDVRDIARMFGEREQIDEQIAAYEARAEELRARLEGSYGGAEASVARIATEQIELYYRCAWPGSVLEEVGLDRPENQRVDDCSESERLDLSAERIPAIDADVLFYFVRGSGGDAEGGRETARRFLENPLWSQLEAVRSDQAFQVDADVWGPAPNVRVANLVLDDLDEYLVDGER